MPKYLDYHGLQTFKEDLDIEFAKKVDKVSGKGLSANDYTNTEKQKVADALVAADIAGKLDSTLKGAANGLAELDNAGKVPASQLPSYVDDVLEYSSLSAFPATGESGKIYVAKDTNKTYRWSGSGYVEISQSLTLGTTSSTAFRGDYGQAAYTHGVTNKGSAFTSGLYKITTNAEGHVTAASVVQKSDITGLGIPGSVPTNVSAFTNDAGYLTQHQDISGKIDVTEKGAANGVAELNANGIVPSDQLPTNVSSFYNDAGYLTQHQDISGKIDMTEKGAANGVAELNSNGIVPAAQLPANVSAFNNDAGYLTQHQDISGKIDSTEKGAANGVASLDSTGKVPASQLPAGQTTVSKIMMNSTEMPMDSSGVVNLGTVVTQHQDISGKIDSTEKGVANGVASLDSTGKVPASQLPAGQTTVSKIMMNSTEMPMDSSGVVNLGTVITQHQDISGKVSTSEKGAANGVAELDANGKVPSSQLPSYVDDVEEYSSVSAFPATGESGKVYVAQDTNVTYRWSGTEYVVIGSDLALGETSSTAYRGDRGAAAYAAAVTNVETSPSSGSSNLITSGAVYNAVNPKYEKPSGGIPASDIASGVIPGVMTGATSSAAGASGLVPAPTSGDDTKYLKGDGSWGIIAADPFTGATASAAGTIGMVPAPSVGDQAKFLKADGTWSDVDALPTVTASDNGKVLTVVSGAWAVAAGGGGGASNDNIAPEYDNTATYAVGALVFYENDLYKCTTAISTAESWDSTHWTQTTVANEITLLTAMISRAAFLTTGNS